MMNWNNVKTAEDVVTEIFKEAYWSIDYHSREQRRRMSSNRLVKELIAELQKIDPGIDGDAEIEEDGDWQYAGTINELVSTLLVDTSSTYHDDCIREAYMKLGAARQLEIALGLELDHDTVKKAALERNSK